MALALKVYCKGLGVLEDVMVRVLEQEEMEGLEV